MRHFSHKGLRQSQNSFVTDEAPISSKWKLKLARLGVGTRLGSDTVHGNGCGAKYVQLQLQFF